MHRVVLLGALAWLLAPTDALAWPAEVQSGAPIRVTAASLADSAVAGAFVRHDDSTLTFRPAGHHGDMRVRFADMSRLEADEAPERASNGASRVFAVIGGLTTGLVAGHYAAGATGSTASGVLIGVLMAVPGALIGGVLGGLIGGAGAVAGADASWAELPRERWASGIPAPVVARADSTLH